MTSSAAPTRRKRFTALHARFLEQLLRGVPFRDACAALEMSKQHGSNVLDHLRRAGVLLAHPIPPYESKSVDPKKDATTVWWTDRETGAVCTVTAVPVGRYERADLRPVHQLVLVRMPEGEFGAAFSDRLRLSYFMVAAELKRHGLEPKLSVPRRGELTEMIGEAMGVEVVLPAYFMTEGTTDGTASSEDGGRD